MAHWVRGFTSKRQYLRALKTPHKRWAQIAITKYRAEEALSIKLRRYQIENRKDWTPAEWQFSRLLKELGLGYHREVGLACQNGKQYFLDFFIRRPRIAFEIDGAVHKNRDSYDTERDIAIMTDFNIPIMRFTNNQVLYEPEKVKGIVSAAIAELRARTATIRNSK